MKEPDYRAIFIGHLVICLHPFAPMVQTPTLTDTTREDHYLTSVTTNHRTRNLIISEFRTRVRAVRDLGTNTTMKVTVVMAIKTHDKHLSLKRIPSPTPSLTSRPYEHPRCKSSGRDHPGDDGLICVMSSVSVL